MKKTQGPQRADFIYRNYLLSILAFTLMKVQTLKRFTLAKYSNE